VTCHVLIIEDEPITALDIEAMFQRHGATSFSFADSEEEAVEAATVQRPDIIASDVKLREGTGPNAVRSILARFGPVPVIFITATPGDCKPCYPPALILAKPVREENIAAAIHELAPAYDPEYRRPPDLRHGSPH
jgi:CheY-like chemotaxis protein